MNILEKIHQDKLIEVRNKKKLVSGEEICAQIKCSEIKIRNFVAAIEDKINSKRTAIIAEVKKASPSKGVIREDFDAANIAKIYEKNGAACISVLTDEKYFLGKNDYLASVKNAVKLPVLRKDFIVDPYQIWEAKLIGADCILLIMAMLDDEKAIKLEEAAIDIGLAVLAEVHDEQELERALKLKTKLIGINNRNLKTMEIDLRTTENLAPNIPPSRIAICESGIRNKLDIARIKNSGVNTFLIGESLMREEDIGLALRKILS